MLRLKCSKRLEDISTLHPPLLCVLFVFLPCSQNGQKKKLSLPLDPRPQDRSGGGGRWRWWGGGVLALQCGASTPAGRRTHGGRASKHPSRFTPPGNPGQGRVSASEAPLSGTLPPFLPVRARDQGSKQRLFPKDGPPSTLWIHCERISAGMSGDGSAI